ncbi:putative non-specific serine/threonine protein kinase [Helianthus annuus]|nr:putative non-specific serine/threonine protein kinase [Helianthus annuus]
MKCFHFSIGHKTPTDEDDNNNGALSLSLSRSSTRASSWARSLSVASTSFDTSRRLDFDSSNNSSDAVGFSELLSQRRANDLRVFTFKELKLATKGFNRSLVIGEGGFGCVYRGVVKVAGDRNLDVAVKQLSRNGLQAWFSFLIF